MKKLLTVVLFFYGISVTAQDAPRLELFCELNVTLAPPIVVGETSHGTRRIINITGGSVTGPQINGQILDGGADWQVLRKDGVTELEAHYQFRTDDGAIIYIKNVGVRVASPDVAARLAKGEVVDAGSYYFRTLPRFEAPIGKYAWINDTIFICTGERTANAVVLRVWRVM
ncbi:MAG TPA: DUF3237 domain-containing protein [Chryseolinea sp.]|nr:DUF3237 domain-containing protein [Chryseolinea sp.]